MDTVFDGLGRDWPVWSSPLCRIAEQTCAGDSSWTDVLAAPEECGFEFNVGDYSLVQGFPGLTGQGCMKD